MRIYLKLFLLAFTLSTALNALAQEQPKPKFELKPYGFVAYEVYMDTYKSVDSRDGESYSYPSYPKFDKISGNDANKRTMLEMAAFTARLGLKITGPDFFGAKTSGLLEMDAMGTKQDYVQLFSLRHAMFKLNWEKSELLLGQTWHPVIVTEMIPNTVSFGAGAPFHALNRSAQVRFTYNFSPIFRILGAASIHGSHRSTGPYDAQRYSGKPDVHVQLSVGNRKEFLAGFSAGYKWLTPRLYVDKDTIGTTETIGSYDLHAFIMIKPASTSVKLEAVYGQNLTYLSMIGGYGKKTGSENLTDDFSYTNLKTLSVWGDIQQDIDKWTIGIFAGYQKLMGADENYTPIKADKAAGIGDYFRDDNLSYIIRVSPRVVYKADALSIGLEYVLTKAVYGSAWDAKHNVTETMDPVSNNRILVRVGYSF